MAKFRELFYESEEEKEGRWITVNNKHIFLKKGEKFDYDKLSKNWDKKRETIKNLKDFNKKEWEDKLEKEELEVINSYTRLSYKYWNSYLRGKISKISEDDSNKIKTLQNLFEKMPKYNGDVIRGVDIGDSRVFLNKFVPGEIVTMKGFVSTTISENSRELGNFIKDEDSSVIFKINSKSGMPIDGLSQYPEENEILFNHNTKFKVVSISDTNEYFTDDKKFIKMITLTEI